MAQCVLRSLEGKYLIVREFEEELKLCAVDLQTKAPKVCIHYRNRKTQMAFEFEYENEIYHAKVDGNSLKLEKADSGNAPPEPDSHWFEKFNDDGSEHYGLQTVVKPPRFISMKTTPIIDLSTTAQQCVRITDVKPE